MGDQKNDFDRVADMLLRAISIVWSVSQLSQQEQNHMLVVGPAALDTALKELHGAESYARGLADAQRFYNKQD